MMPPKSLPKNLSEPIHLTYDYSYLHFICYDFPEINNTEVVLYVDDIALFYSSFLTLASIFTVRLLTESIHYLLGLHFVAALLQDCGSLTSSSGYCQPSSWCNHIIGVAPSLISAVWVQFLYASLYPGFDNSRCPRDQSNIFISAAWSFGSIFAIIIIIIIIRVRASYNLN